VAFDRQPRYGSPEVRARSDARVRSPRGIHFPVVSVEEDAPTYVFGFVSLRPEDVVAWHLEGLANEATAAALWAEMEGPTESE